MGKNTRPLISVIVPVYNVEKYIKKCAESLVNQTYQNTELIFVDDGTKDRSIDVLKEIKDKRIKIIHQENGGVSAARNKGLDIAKGEYVIFLDSDDYAAEDYIEYLFKLANESDADFAYSTETFKSKTDRQVEKDEIRIVDGDQSSGILLSPDVIVGSYNKIYRKKVIEKNKLKFRSDLFYGEGLNFIIRMSLVSKKVAIGKRKIAYYRKNNLASATTKYNHEKFRNGLKSLEIVNGMINKENSFVNAMYRLHLSTFYLGAVTKMIENKKVQEYYDDYKEWRKALKSSVRFIVGSNYISNYRKCMIVMGAYFPHLLAAMDKKRSARIIRNSV